MLLRIGRPSLRICGINSAIPFLFIVTILVLFFIMHGATTLDPEATASSSHFKYTTVKGYFLQSEDNTDSSKFDFKKQNFGLIEREYEDHHGQRHEGISQWQRFESYVRHLNEKSEDGVRFKVLLLGRHGQGWHNVAETKYGTEAWDCYWSMLDGADGITWSDANLTGIGKGQAQDVNDLWKALLPKGIPAPETYYVSPLTRTIETADVTFKGLRLPDHKPYKPIIKELLREAIGVHTCDRRSTATYIRESFPHVELEENFSEEDRLWSADYREPSSARKYRLSKLLDDVFAHDNGAFLSLTSHSGAIASVLEAVGHRSFDLETGGVIPAFVKAERVHGERERPPHEPSEGPPACKLNPAGLPD
ncbi:phosphoglycerate mutase-like protein [Lindgomyces ingoldianus]|uniref:Phosphoglycerate mutase-like protein n=1 Tax=Lindgomyces ingoldianus TaxID=673940 RepID=A0ACB6R969_9PLEO|nr:phosphoglycerate mutase-like protein [Lindgomyces ingoldianus]KAF2475313.1 phosphoglycerate mutase-like protein [Lindgomyces ingoldianus]